MRDSVENGLMRRSIDGGADGPEAPELRTARGRAPLALAALAALAAGLAPGAAPLAAQEPDTAEVPSGVRLGMIYQTRFRPELAVRPFAADPDEAGVADRIEAIVRRDLAQSDRFEMSEMPPALASGPVDYEVWNGMGVVYLVTGRVQAAQDGYQLRVMLHDVVYGEIEELQAFRLPSDRAPDFRMAVHAVSDQVVRWATGEPGMAASRIAFVQRRTGGGYDLMVVDADGENLERLAGSGDIMLGPSWTPDGSRLAYAAGGDDGWRIIEHELGDGGTRVMTHRPGLNYTPAYSPDGGRLAFASTAGSGTAIYTLDAAQGCCIERLTRASGDDLSPTYSPDGERIAFNSNRLGQPHIYLIEANGGEPAMLSPFVYGESGYYTSPDWSPVGSLVAFHGRSRGRFQIMVADAANPGAAVRQLTTEGESEDPSWAPDGRHIVFSGTRSGGSGLFVLDTVTGRVRALTLGGDYIVPDWSTALVRASDYFAGGR